MNNINTNPIASSAMLVDLNLSVYTGRKLDKKVSSEIDADKRTKGKAGAYHKSLFAGTQTLDDIVKLAAQVRVWHYSQTLCWSDNGSRLLPTALFMDYKKQLGLYEQQFYHAVDKFLYEYNTLISAAAFTLGDLFDRTEYPDVDSVRGKFGFRYVFAPVPEHGDFRVDVGNHMMAELQQQYKSAFERNTSQAMKDVWDRLYTVLGNISDRLTVGEDGKGRVFRDSLVDNANELLGILPMLNITQDIRMEELRRQLADSLDNVEAQDLRDDTFLRAKVKAQVDDMLDKFSF